MAYARTNAHIPRTSQNGVESESDSHPFLPSSKNVRCVDDSSNNKENDKASVAKLRTEKSKTLPFADELGSEDAICNFRVDMRETIPRADVTRSNDAICKFCAEKRETTPSADDEGRSEKSTGRGGKLRKGLMKFNIGGAMFITHEDTLFQTKTEGAKLSDRSFVTSLYDPYLDEYFLDRDPKIFRSILNFMRSGKLHLPTGLCGPQIKEELAYWGVSELHIEPCCWHNFSSWNSTMESLQQLERDSKLRVITSREEGPLVLKVRLWRTLTDPSSSLPAKIYGWLALLFVMMAIFSFVASTHQAFRVPIHRPQFAQNHNPNHTQHISNTTTAHNNSNAAPSPDYASRDAEAAQHPFMSVKDRLRNTEAHAALWCVDLVCLAFFSIEYILKVIFAPRKVKFILSFNGVVDVLAVSPDYVEFIVVAVDPEQINSGQFILFIPFLRLMRAFRIFRLIRHVPGLWIMVYTLKASYKDLSLMLIFLLVGTLLFASIIFFVDDKDTFTSIPHSFWWAIVTMTTVGYGDMYPVTWAGYCIGSVTAICGVMIIGFTIPALVNNFILYYQHVQFAIQKEKLRKNLQADDAKGNECGKDKSGKIGEKDKPFGRAGKISDLNGGTDIGVESIPLVRQK